MRGRACAYSQQKHRCFPPAVWVLGTRHGIAGAATGLQQSYGVCFNVGLAQFYRTRWGCLMRALRMAELGCCWGVWTHKSCCMLVLILPRVVQAKSWSWRRSARDLLESGVRRDLPRVSPDLMVSNTSRPCAMAWLDPSWQREGCIISGMEASSSEARIWSFS